MKDLIKEKISNSTIAIVCMVILFFLMLLSSAISITRIQSECNAELANKDIYIFELNEQLVEKDETIENLNSMVTELNDDLTSAELQYSEEISALKQEIESLETEMDIICVNAYKEAVAAIPEDYPDYIRTYILDGGEVEDIGTWKCTAYCTEKYKHICGTGSGITASGEEVVANWSVAVNKSNLSWLPFGTRVYIEDVGEREIMDTGGGVAKNQMDCANGTHSEALAWSKAGKHRVWILK